MSMNKSIIGTILGACTVALYMVSCSKSNGDQFTSSMPSTCDTVNMKYATDVVTILQAHCYGCHGGNSTAGSGGIALDSYINLKVFVDNGKLVGNISHAAGFVPMPYGLPKLDDCSINKVIDWVNNGAQNN